ncbi:DUF4164 family protein [Marinivivus vitaminiproducens]|uniref:DUF4164 family protein n=1 Tax=Marinivivus vitaminiproducens TaxID=3035935 RepID=UPI00279C38D6|nr:DUF4164 family protein [Geminicoccaceae bacterium SCSIO 64248]
MSALQAAQRRLDQALARLEAALSRPFGDTDSSGLSHTPRVDLAPDVAALRDECGRLQHALEASQRENERLRLLADDTALKLDSTIAELNMMLES